MAVLVVTQQLTAVGVGGYAESGCGRFMSWQGAGCALWVGVRGIPSSPPPCSSTLCNPPSLYPTSASLFRPDVAHSESAAHSWSDRTLSVIV
jgi:hypothetical protein